MSSAAPRYSLMLMLCSPRLNTRRGDSLRHDPLQPLTHMLNLLRASRVRHPLIRLESHTPRLTAPGGAPLLSHPHARLAA